MTWIPPTLLQMREFRARISVIREHTLYAADIDEAERRFAALAQTHGGAVVGIYDTTRFPNWAAATSEKRDAKPKSDPPLPTTPPAAA